MNVITEQEKQQILEGSSCPQQQQTRSIAPCLPMSEFFRQVEQFAQLFPQSPRPFARGTSWRL